MEPHMSPGTGPSSLDAFSGKARLFPLPNLVLFPHVTQPLHVFEPRYRELLAEALGADKLLALAILAPGWEADYEGRPALRPVACLARVIAHHCFRDGSSNILVSGVRRVRLIRELPPTKPFREAEVDVLEDFYPDDEISGRDLRYKFREALTVVLARFLGPGAFASEGPLPHPLAGAILAGLNGPDLGVVADVVSSMLDVGLEKKAALLAEPDVYRRVGTLVDLLGSLTGDDALGAAGACEFPPQFSAN